MRIVGMLALNALLIAGCDGPVTCSDGFVAIPVACDPFGQRGQIPPNPPDPHIAVDRAGNGVAVWSGTASVLEANSAAWRPDESLALGPGGDGDVVMAGTGRAYVGAAGEDELLLLGFDLDAGSEAAATRLPNGPLPLSDVRLASSLYGASGNVFVVWRERIMLDSFTEIAVAFARRKPPGGDWGPPLRIDVNPPQTGPKPESVFNLRVAAGGDGNAVAVWERGIGVDGVASFAARRTASGWLEPVMLAGGKDGTGMPDIGMDGAGNAIAVYVEDDAVYARGMPAATGLWTAPRLLGDGDVAISPRIAVNGDGTAVAAWSTLQTPSVHAVRFVPAVGWTPKRLLDGGTVGLKRDVRVAIDAAGRSRVLWESTGRVWTAAHDGSDWAPVEDLGAGERPDLAMAPGGRAIGVWRTDGQLQRMVWDPAPEPAPVDEGRVVFASDRFNDNWEIYTMKPDGTEVTRRTINDARDTDPVWSPDGSKFCFVSDRDAFQPGATDLYIRDIEAGVTTRLTYFGTDGGFARDPAWSPGGNEIAFAGEIGASGIYVIRVADGEFRQLTTGRIDRWPAWSPDGKFIAFVSQGMWLYDVDQDTARRIHTDATARGPAWSPDGLEVVFVVQARIVRANVVTGIPIEISAQLGDNEDPDWALERDPP